MNLLIIEKQKAAKEELIEKTKNETVKTTLEQIKTKMKEKIENEKSIKHFIND